MHLLPLLLFVHSFTATSSAQIIRHDHEPCYEPRPLNTLIDPEDTAPAQSYNILPQSLDLHNILPDSSFFKKLDLRNAAEIIPFLKDLRKRATPPAAAAAPATNANADDEAAPAQAVQPAAGKDDEDDTGVAAQQPAAGAVAPAVAAPVAGGGGGAGPAAAQPAPGAQANGISVIEVTTVVGGVTKVIPSTFSQKFAGGQSAPPVQTGTIGLGTLTGKIGVVKSSEAKNDGVNGFERTGIWWSISGIIATWTLTMTMSGALFGLGLV